MKMMWGSMCFCAVLLVLGCEDQLGNQQDDDNTASTASGAENGADGHNSSSDPTEQNPSTNSTTTANTSTPSTQSDDPREQPGQWADEERFTIIPRAHDPSTHEDPSVNFCPLLKWSESLVILRAVSQENSVPRCSSIHEPKNARAYSTYKVERLMHIGGKKVPIKFALNQTGQNLDFAKNYIIGVFKYGDTYYSSGVTYEIVLYDPESESNRVTFSGKKESLVQEAEAGFDDQTNSRCDNPTTYDLFERYMFDVEGTRCR